MKSIKFMICIQNTGADDLQLGKVYQVLPDEKSEKEGYVRIVDESEDDYLYPQSFFVSIQLPQAAERALFSVASR
jgi:hypothetical protein